MELEYEGELKGADTIARELIRAAVGRVFSKHFTDINFQPVIQWFELGGELKLPDLATTSERYQQLSKIQGLLEHVGRLGRSEEHRSELQSQSNLVCRLLLEKKKTTLS